MDISRARKLASDNEIIVQRIRGALSQATMPYDSAMKVDGWLRKIDDDFDAIRICLEPNIEPLGAQSVVGSEAALS